MIEDLSQLTNFDMDTALTLCLVLIGLTGLRQRPSMAVHESMQQRLIVQHLLRGLTREDLDAYLAHRLRLRPAVQRVVRTAGTSCTARPTPGSLTP